MPQLVESLSGQPNQYSPNTGKEEALERLRMARLEVGRVMNSDQVCFEDLMEGNNNIIRALMDARTNGATTGEIDPTFSCFREAQRLAEDEI